MRATKIVMENRKKINRVIQEGNEMKKILALLLSLALPLSLAACNTAAPAAESSGAPASSAAPAESAAPPASADKVTISFINGFTGGDGPFMSKIVDGFNASQDQYVIEQLQDQEHYVKFKTDDFDMLIIHSDWISTYHADGLLREMSDIYDAAGLSIDDFHEITKTYAQYEDGVFAAPLDLYAYTMFYNKELVDTPPQTYADLVALRDKLDSETSNIYPMAVPLTGDHDWLIRTFLLQMEVDMVEDGHLKFDTDEAAEACLMLNRLIYQDKLSPANLGANDHLNAFMKQVEGKNDIQAAIALMGPWNYTAAKEKYGDNLGVATIPTLGNTLRVPAGGHNFAVSARLQDPDKIAGIAAFLKYAYQPEVNTNWADAGQAPINLKVMEAVKQNPEQWPVANVNYTIFGDARILPAIYNVREQNKYLITNVYSLIISTPDLTKEQLMPELENATKIAAELAEQ